MIKFLKLFIIIISLYFGFVRIVSAATLDPVMAKILLVIISNVEWNQKNITLCTYGRSRVGSLLQETSTNFEPSENVHKINILDNLDTKDFSKCNMLYIVPEKASELSSIVKEIVTNTILTVSDMEDFVENDGMIGVTIGRRNNLILDFNEPAISRAKIKIDPVFLLGHKAK